MKVMVPDGILEGMSIDQKDILFDLALGMYADGRLTLGQAAELASLPQPAFLKELGKRSIPVHYGPRDLKTDLETIGKL